MENSSHIFDKNYFNLLTMYILKNKQLYDQVMENPSIIKTMTLKLPEYYYQYDYGFPNLNYCVYEFGTEEQRKERIYKMYYADDAEKNWFKLIR